MHIENPKHEFVTGKFVTIAVYSAVSVLYIVHLTGAYNEVWGEYHTAKIISSLFLTLLPIYLLFNWALRPHGPKTGKVNDKGDPIRLAEKPHRKRTRYALVTFISIGVLCLSFGATRKTIEHDEKTASLPQFPGLNQRAKDQVLKARQEICDTLEKILLFSTNDSVEKLSIAQFRERIVNRSLNAIKGEVANSESAELFQSRMDSLISVEIKSTIDKIHSLSKSLNTIIAFPSGNFDSCLEHYMYADQSCGMPDVDSATKLVRYRTSAIASQGFIIPGMLIGALHELHDDGIPVKVVKYLSANSGKIDTLFIKY